MKVPAFIVALFAGAVLTLQGWTLSEIVALKTQVATLQVQLAAHLAIAK